MSTVAAILTRRGSSLSLSLLLSYLEQINADVLFHVFCGVSIPHFNMNGSEWGLKMQSDIHKSKHMVTFEQHLSKMGAISANGEKSKIDRDAPLKSFL